MNWVSLQPVPYQAITWTNSALLPIGLLGTNLTWIWKDAFLPLLVLFHWYICLCYNAHKRCTKKNSLKLPDVCVNVFSELGRIPSGTIHINLRMPAVAICDLSQFVIKALTCHIDSNYTKKSVMGTWESTHLHFWHNYERFHICRFWCYFTGTSVLCISLIKPIIDAKRKPSW